MIEQFVVKLENLLAQYEISEQEKNDIIADYKQMIEDGIQKGLTEEAIIEMLGTPDKVVKELGLRHKHSKHAHGGEKIIALSPFISLIIFFVLGFTKDLWHPGWLVFLLVPITAILVELGTKKDKHLLTALSPFIAFAFFFTFGFIYDIWHPTWLIFLIIPLFGILNTRDEMDKLTLFTALSPFISFIAFILIGYYTGEYKYTWLILLLVVFLGILHERKISTKLLLLSSFTLSIVLYLVIEKTYGNWSLALLAFLIFIITGVFTNNIQISGFENKTDKLICLISLILFLGVGLLFNIWALSWLFLLIVPIAMIIKYNHAGHTLTALSPFISLTIFFLLGFFLDLWHLSWLAFLLVPIIAIIEER